MGKGVRVTVGVLDGWGVMVLAGVRVWVGVGVRVMVAVGVMVGVFVIVAVPVGVGIGVGVGRQPTTPSKKEHSIRALIIFAGFWAIIDTLMRDCQLGRVMAAAP